MADDEDENKKDWGKEKKPPAKKPEKRRQVDDGFTKERTQQQLIDGLTRLCQVGLPLDALLQDDQSQTREGIINRFELNDLRRRLENTGRQNQMIVLELDRANLETRRMKLQLESVKATSQLKIERAELETDKVRFEGQKEKAESLIEMLKMKQELQQVKRDNYVKGVEIGKLKAEVDGLNRQVDTLKASSSGGDNMASYMASGVQFLAMQQNTQLLQGRMMHTHRTNNTAPRNHSSPNYGEGFYVCAQCMVAEFPNSLEGQRMLERHLETEHPERGTLSEAPHRDK